MAPTGTILGASATLVNDTIAEGEAKTICQVEIPPLYPFDQNVTLRATFSAELDDMTGAAIVFGNGQLEEGGIQVGDPFPIHYGEDLEPTGDCYTVEATDVNPGNAGCLYTVLVQPLNGDIAIGYCCLVVEAGDGLLPVA